MKTVTWSLDLQSTIRNLKKQPGVESANKFSQHEQQGVQRAFGKTSTKDVEKEFAGEWF